MTLVVADVAADDAAVAGAPARTAAEAGREVALPTLRRAHRVIGKTLVLRDATVADAAFILALRTDPVKGANLSQTSPRLEDQQAWLAAYAARQGDIYFVIESLAGKPLGTVRLYDARGTSFCWGSWILSDESPPGGGIESSLMVYAYAIGHLGFEAAHFQVNLANERVWSYHERFGAVRTHQDEHEIHYTLSGEAIRASMQRYRRYLPDGITVVEGAERRAAPKPAHITSGDRPIYPSDEAQT